jgi:hypothetical protein
MGVVYKTPNTVITFVSLAIEKPAGTSKSFPAHFISHGRQGVTLNEMRAGNETVLSAQNQTIDIGWSGGFGRRPAVASDLASRNQARYSEKKRKQTLVGAPLLGGPVASSLNQSIKRQCLSTTNPSAS